MSTNVSQQPPQADNTQQDDLRLVFLAVAAKRLEVNG